MDLNFIRLYGVSVVLLTFRPSLLSNLMMIQTKYSENAFSQSIRIGSFLDLALFLFGFGELSLFLIQFPNTFMDFFLLLYCILSFTVLFILFEGALKDIPFGICYHSIAMNLIIFKVPIVLEGSLTLLDLQLPLSLLFACFKQTQIIISISIFQLAMAMKLAFFKESFVCFIFIFIDSFSTLDIIMEIPLIDDSIRLCQNSLSYFLSHLEFTLIDMIILIVFQFSFPIKLIILKLALVLCHPLQKQFPISIFLTIFK